MVAVSCSWLHVVAPPGVRLTPVESHEQRAHWRHVAWAPGEDGEAALPASDSPEFTHRISAREALEIVGAGGSDFVRDALIRQLRLAATLGRTSAGGARVEDHERAAGRAANRARKELTECFPAESWDDLLDPEEEGWVPETSDELLARIPVLPAVAESRPGLIRRFLKQILPPFMIGIGRKVVPPPPPRPALAVDEQADGTTGEFAQLGGSAPT
jgi:hypothetical protein